MATESGTDTVNIWEINGNQAIKKNYINVIGEKVGWIEAMQFFTGSEESDSSQLQLMMKI